MSEPVRLSRILKAVERKRLQELERISNVLHDETGALLTGVGLKLELLRMDGVEGLDDAIGTLEKAFDSVRQLSRDVHPELVTRVGLGKALKGLADKHRIRWNGGWQQAIDANVSGPTEMYGIADELLDNAIRHSNASTIELRLTPTGELIVRDDGVGITRSSATTGVGLLQIGFLSGRGHLRVRLRTLPGFGTMFRVTQLTPCHSTFF